MSAAALRRTAKLEIGELIRAPAARHAENRDFVEKIAPERPVCSGGANSPRKKGRNREK